MFVTCLSAQFERNLTRMSSTRSAHW